MKIYPYKNGHVTFEKTFPHGYYNVVLRIAGEVKDKVLCDDYQDALAYCRSFRKIAKNA